MIRVIASRHYEPMSFVCNTEEEAEILLRILRADRAYTEISTRPVTQKYAAFLRSEIPFSDVPEEDRP